MSFRKLNQPLTVRSSFQVLGWIACAATLLFLGILTYRWITSGPQSPRQVKNSIRKYLQKQTRKSDFKTNFDFSLKETVTRLQTNVVLLKQDLAQLSTTITSRQQEVSSLKKEFAAAQAEERTLRHQVSASNADLAEKNRRLSNRQSELATAQTNFLNKEANLNASQNEVAALQMALTNLHQIIATQQPELTMLQKNLTAAQKSLPGKPQDLKSTQRDLAAKTAEVATRQKSLDAMKFTVLSLQTNVASLQAIASAVKTDLETRQATWAARQKEVAAKEATLAAKQKQAATLQTNLSAKQKEIAGLQKDLAAKEEALSSQQRQFARNMRTKVNEAGSYESIYLLIGQQLWTADKLLASHDPAQQRAALNLAVESIRHALDSAENAWLGARICEGYLWPNLELADPKGKPRQNLEELLQTCDQAFQRAEEPANAIKNYKLMLDYAANERRADAARYHLANAFEDAGDFNQALHYYRAIQGTNYTKQAERRITTLEEKRQLSRASTK